MVSDCVYLLQFFYYVCAHFLQSLTTFLLSIRSIDRPFHRCGCGGYTTPSRSVHTTLFPTSPPIVTHLLELVALLPIPHHPINRFPTSRSHQPPSTTMADPQPNQGAPTAIDPPQSTDDNSKTVRVCFHVCALICNALTLFLCEKMQTKPPQRCGSSAATGMEGEVLHPFVSVFELH
jgi:hypothetical protein